MSICGEDRRTQEVCLAACGRPKDAGKLPRQDAAGLSAAFFVAFGRLAHFLQGSRSVFIAGVTKVQTSYYDADRCVSASGVQLTRCNHVGSPLA